MKKKLFTIITLAFAVFATTSCKKEQFDRKTDTNHIPEIIKNAVADIDGNNYDAVVLGGQVWMTKNLMVTRYSDGTVIPIGTAQNSDSPAFYKHDDYVYTDENNVQDVSKYGYLYNKAAVMRGKASSNTNPSKVQGVCPAGWHIPSLSELEQLADYVKNAPEFWARHNGVVAKNCVAHSLASEYGWEKGGNFCPGDPNLTHNISGLSIPPAGAYYPEGDWFTGIGSSAYIWSCTDFEECDGRVHNLRLYNHEGYNLIGATNDDFAMSVRCVRD